MAASPVQAAPAPALVKDTKSDRAACKLSGEDRGESNLLILTRLGHHAPF